MRSFANVCWAFSHAGHNGRGVLEVFAEGAGWRAPQFSAIDLSSVGWALAKNETSQGLIVVACEASLKCAHMSARQLSNLVWAWAAHPCGTVRGQSVVLAQEVTTRSATVPVVDLVTVAGALARAGSFIAQTAVAQVVDTIGVECCRRGVGVTGLTTVLWSLAVCRASSTVALSTATAIAHRTIELDASLVARTMWALAARRCACAPLTHVLTEQASRFEGSAQDMANTSWAYAVAFIATSVCESSRAVAGVAVSATRQVSSMTSQHVASIVWAMATLVQHHAPLVEAVTDRKQLRARDLAVSSWAFAVMECRGSLGAWRGLLASAMLEYSVQDLSNVAWACAFVSLRDPPLMMALVTGVPAKLFECEPLHLTNVAWSCATLAPLSKAKGDGEGGRPAMSWFQRGIKNAGRECNQSSVVPENQRINIRFSD